VYDISVRVIAEIGKTEYDAGAREVELNVNTSRTAFTFID